MAGSAWAFCLAFALIITWALTGSIFNYSDTWQLVINTGTTIVTFLMVFLIQNTQNRDGKAMHIKLDELLRATKARRSYIDIEDLSDDDLEVLSAEFNRIPKTEANSELLKKLSHRLQDTLTKRRALPGENVANHMANMLNPFSQHVETKDKNKK